MKVPSTRAAIATILALCTSGAAQAEGTRLQESPLQPARRLPSARTPLGPLSVSNGQLVLGGRTLLKRNDEARIEAISTNYVYTAQTDVLVLHTKGPECPTLFRWYSITENVVTRSPLFGNCSDTISIENKKDRLTITAASFGTSAISGRYEYDGKTLLSTEPMGSRVEPRKEISEVVWRATSNSTTAEKHKNPNNNPSADQNIPSRLAAYYKTLKNKAADQRQRASVAAKRAQNLPPLRNERYRIVPIDSDKDPMFFIDMATILNCTVREGITHEVKNMVAQFWEFPGGCMDDGTSRAYGAVIAIFPNGSGNLGVLMSPQAAEGMLQELYR